ncbi:MAG: hypothetical protein IJP16_01410 [Clostridia bacterium]|nr:hypothetical protein [Clostridia bacterium]
MIKQKADELIIKYLPKIYGFAMKKAFSYDEAEELSSDIVTEVYKSFLSSKEIYNVDGYVWRISEHVYSKFVSSKKKREGISIDGMDIPDYTPIFDESPEEELNLLRREIAFLTQLRRQIIYSFYYENKSITAITREMGIPEGTVKWHLNKSRNELKEGFTMERRIGKLGIKPIEAIGFAHNGNPGTNGGPEYYLNNKLNLNIVYSVYHSPKTLEEIAEELGVTPVYIEDSVKALENNGFLVRESANRFTTYVYFNSETYSLEQEYNQLEKKMEVAKLLTYEYVPIVREAIKNFDDIYIPGENRELFEATVIFYAISNKCEIKLETDLSQYRIKTLDGGEYMAMVDIPATASDPNFIPPKKHPSYAACGNMNRWSEKYPSVYSWSIDSRYSSRKGTWKNNLTSDYEYLYEVLTGAINESTANKEKFERLRNREFLTDDNKINVMIVRADPDEFFSKLPSLDESFKKLFADYAFEEATLLSNDYPPQMRDYVMHWNIFGFVGREIALMVMDILYENGTFRPLTENEKVTSNLLMFCDKLPDYK